MSFVEGGINHDAIIGELTRQRYSGESGVVVKSPGTETGTQSMESEPAGIVGTKPTIANKDLSVGKTAKRFARPCKWRDFTRVILK